MNTDHTTPADFEGCTRKCRLAGTHTLVWGQCEQAPAPEPTVSLSRVYTDTDGQRSIGFDTYTVDQLAELLDPVLGFEAMRARKGAVDLAHLAAHVIVHRHDAPSAAPAGQTPATDPTPPAGRTAAPVAWIDGHPHLEAIAAAVWERCDTENGLVVDDPRNIALAALAALAAVLPPPADRAAVLTGREKAMLAFALEMAEEEIHARSLDFTDDDKAALASLRRMADKTQPAPCSCGVLRAGPGRHLPECPNRPAGAVRTPCSVPECDVDGTGEPCDRHEREDSHAEGNHELCGANCPAAAERQDGAQP